MNNVILTPHIAGLSYEAFQSMMSGAIENIDSFEKGEFEKAVGQLTMTRKSLSQLWPRLVSRRVEGLVSQARSAKAAGDWSKCAEAARAALAVDTLNFEADQLLDEACRKLKEHDDQR